MNYVRGAFSAVTSYYTSLPPINASTLTGAIDVIVVERADGELACSPFHVRLGKWQVLRPGEKQVTVLVNGKTIPYSMKIGDAGEAFFVFETDEDVPEELMTSPILGPTQVQPPGTPNPEAERQHATAGRFGASDDHDVTGGGEDDSENADNPKLTPKVSRHGKDASNRTIQMNEPSFLDLDSTVNPGDLTPSAPPTPSFSESEEANGVLDGSASLASQAASVLKAGPQLAKSILVNAPNTAIDNIASARDHLRDARSKARDALRGGAHTLEGPETEHLPELANDAGMPPEIQYGGDVVVDMAGYHNPKAAEGSSESSRDSSPSPRPLDDAEGLGQSALTLDTPPPEEAHASTSSLPELSTPPHPLHLRKSTSSYVRGGSAPPETGLHLNLPDVGPTPPDYTWEWGAFPTPSPVRRSFSLVKDDSDVHVSTSASSQTLSRLGQTVTSARDLEVEFSGMGRGGALSPDEGPHRDPGLFWVTIDGKRFPFQLSVCKKRERKWDDDVESARSFEDGRIDYEGLWKEPSLVESEDLVMKWGDKFIIRRDDSPLLSALLMWRHNMKPMDRPPIPSSMSDPEPSSPPTSPPLPATGAPSDKRSSRWASWWTRSRGTPGPSSVPSSTGTGRPGLSTNASAPPDLEMGNQETASSMERTESFPSKAAPASIALPASRANSPAPPSPPQHPIRQKNYVKTLRLTSDQLKALSLKKGANTITFSLSSTGVVACTAKIFVWDEGDHVVVSDIDGTITKSDALGHMFNLIGRDWTHLGVAKLYTDISRNGYKMMYLTSRAIGQADSTRDYLKGIKQNNYQLPEGPVVMSPDRLMASLHREVIMRKPEVFKMACLRDIQRLFGIINKNPFYAGFGNRITDALSYRSVNVPSARIFTIDSAGEVKMELLELAGYKSSYIHMTDLVDQFFPPVHRKWATEFTDFNYWRDPIPEVELPDLGPPLSPALSAVSDTSGGRLGRLRNFSLRTSPSHNGIAASAAEAVARGRKEASPSPLARSVDERSASTLVTPDSSSERYHRRSRRKLSVDSMPGSLPGSEYDSEDDDTHLEEGEHDGEEDDYEDDEDDEDEEPVVFDDDIVATGEMENVPFI